MYDRLNPEYRKYENFSFLSPVIEPILHYHYRHVNTKNLNDPTENRTPIFGMKARCTNRYTMGPFSDCITHIDICQAELEGFLYRFDLPLPLFLPLNVGRIESQLLQIILKLSNSIFSALPSI